MGWASHVGLLNAAVPKHLGEDLTLAEASPGTETATVRGLLLNPEQLQRLGLGQIIAGDSRLTLRSLDAPVWLQRGVTVARGAETYRVVEWVDNGEGMIEVTLCRLS